MPSGIGDSPGGALARKFVESRPREAYDARNRGPTENSALSSSEEHSDGRGRNAMKHLIKQYLDSEISRRQLLSGLGTLGITAAAANSMAQSLAPFLPTTAEDAAANPPSGSSASRNVQGTGGALLVAQLKASGVGHIFFHPSSGAAPFFDALVDEPQMTLIKALQEGALVAMADGYAKASGEDSVCDLPPAGVSEFDDAAIQRLEGRGSHGGGGGLRKPRDAGRRRLRGC